MFCNKIYRFILERLDIIEESIHHLNRRIINMATQQDLDNTIAPVSAKLDTLTNVVNKFIADFNTKSAPDLQPQVDAVNALGSKVDTIQSAIGAADPNAVS